MIHWKNSWETEKLLHSWLWFITAEGYRLNAAKGKSTWGIVQEKPYASFQVSLSVES